MKEMSCVDLWSNTIFNSFLDKNMKWLEAKSVDQCTPLEYLKVQTLLHLPYYSADQLMENDGKILDDIGAILSDISRSYRATYQTMLDKSKLNSINTFAKISGYNCLTVCDGASSIPVRFGIVEDDVASRINNELHYIRSVRKDNIVSLGLFLGDKTDVPYACASFSYCKRLYQLKSINSFLCKDTGDCDLDLGQVLVMTRAFTFDNSPKNSMSKLYHQSYQYIRKNITNVKVIITALNPFLGFNGGSFLGSSYKMYALCPMEYWYDNCGRYVPRSKGVVRQSTPTPPIVWLARGVDRNIAKIIEYSSGDNIVAIEKERYARG